MTLRPIYALGALAVSVLLIALASTFSFQGVWGWTSSIYHNAPYLLFTIAATAFVIVGLWKMFENRQDFPAKVMTYIGLAGIIALFTAWFLGDILAWLMGRDFLSGLPLPTHTWLALGLGTNLEDVSRKGLGLYLWFQWGLVALVFAIAFVTLSGHKAVRLLVALLIAIFLAMGIYQFNLSAWGIDAKRNIKHSAHCVETGSCPDYDFTVYAGGHSAPIPVYSDCDRGRRTICVWAQEVAQHGITTKTYGMFKVKNRDGSRRWVTGNPVCHEYLRVHVEGTPGSYKQFKVHRINGPCPARVRPSHND